MITFVPTAQQKALIELPDGPHLVSAPPGTGKTQVLTYRVVHLLERQPQATFRILALTFTTKAAETLRARIRDRIGDLAGRVHACNFHSFCLDVLQHYGDLVDFPHDTTVYEAEEQRLEVLARALVQDGLPVPEKKELRALLERIGVFKRDLKAPDVVEDPDDAAAYEAYNGLLRLYHACDFDDLLERTWRLMVEQPQVAKHYRRMFRHIVVDEAQDTSRAQYEILRAVCGTEHRNVMLVADSDQFIYRFAGASSEWLDAFVTDFSAIKHELFENFRCASVVIDAANRLVQNQPGRLPKPLMAPVVPAPGAVYAVSFHDEQHEANGVADWVEELLSNGLDPATLYTTESPAIRPEDICVLCRTRSSLDSILSEFQSRGIEHLFSTGRTLVETPEGRLVLNGLKVLQNPADRVTRESILAVWAQSLLGGGAGDVAVSEFLERLANASPAAAPYANVLRISGGDVTETVRGLIAAIAQNAVSSQSKDEQKALALGLDAAALGERWRQYAGHTSPTGRSIGGFLGDVALAGKSIIDGPGVRVLTVHVAKGLEFKAVALVGMNEGTLPDFRNVSRGADLADERRIAYVAVTRASRLLLLTRPRARIMPWGDRKTQEESRFVADMGLTMIAR